MPDDLRHERLYPFTDWNGFTDAKPWSHTLPLLGLVVQDGEEQLPWRCTDIGLGSDIKWKECTDNRGIPTHSFGRRACQSGSVSNRKLS